MDWPQIGKSLVFVEIMTTANSLSDNVLILASVTNRWMFKRADGVGEGELS